MVDFVGLGGMSCSGLFYVVHPSVVLRLEGLDLVCDGLELVFGFLGFLL